jgi:hypothetical protein
MFSDSILSDRFGRRRVSRAHGEEPTIHRNRGDTVADSTALTEAERAKLEQRRERLMKLIKDGGSDLEADDRADLQQEWNKIDNLLNRR